ncbi:MAG: hypothetical protein IIB82_13515 [Bacteroidetes bacterium]|nr:hypothetical protein [Bacteroidota bacterium]
MLLILISGWIGSCGDDPPEPLPVTTLVITTVDEDGAFIQGVKVNLYRTIPAGYQKLHRHWKKK